MKNTKSKKGKIILFGVLILILAGTVLIVSAFDLIKGSDVEKTIKEVTIQDGMINIKITGTQDGIELKTYRNGTTNTENFPKGNYIFKTEYADLMIDENLKFNITDYNEEVYEKNGIKVSGVTDFLGNTKTLEIEIQNPEIYLYKEILNSDETFKEIVGNKVNDSKINNKFNETVENTNDWNDYKSISGSRGGVCFGDGECVCSFDREWFVVNNKLYLAELNEDENKIKSIYEIMDVTGMAKDEIKYEIREIVEKIDSPDSPSSREEKEKINQILKNNDEFNLLTEGDEWSIKGGGGPMAYKTVYVGGKESYFVIIDMILEKVIDIKDMSIEEENEITVKDEDIMKHSPPLTSKEFEENWNESRIKEEMKRKALNPLEVALADDRVKQIINGKRYEVRGQGSSIIENYGFEEITLGIGGTGDTFDEHYDIFIDWNERRVLAVKNINEISNYYGEKKFKLDTSYEQYLKNGTVDDALIKAFKDNNISLFNGAKISQKGEVTWAIENEDGMIHFIEKPQINNKDEELFVRGNICRIIPEGKFKKLTGSELSELNYDKIKNTDANSNENFKNIVGGEAKNVDEFKDIAESKEWEIVYHRLPKSINPYILVWFVVDDKTLYKATIDTYADEIKSIDEIKEVTGMSNEEIKDEILKTETFSRGLDHGEEDRKIREILKNDAEFRELVDDEGWGLGGNRGAHGVSTSEYYVGLDIIVYNGTNNRTYWLRFDLVSENLLEIDDITDFDFSKFEFNDSEHKNKAKNAFLSNEKIKELLKGERKIYMSSGGGGKGPAENEIFKIGTCKEDFTGEVIPSERLFILEPEYKQYLPKLKIGKSDEISDEIRKIFKDNDVPLPGDARIFRDYVTNRSFAIRTNNSMVEYTIHVYDNSDHYEGDYNQWGEPVKGVSFFRKIPFNRAFDTTQPIYTAYIDVYEENVLAIIDTKNKKIIGGDALKRIAGNILNHTGEIEENKNKSKIAGDIKTLMENRGTDGYEKIYEFTTKNGEIYEIKIAGVIESDTGETAGIIFKIKKPDGVEIQAIGTKNTDAFAGNIKIHLTSATVDGKYIQTEITVYEQVDETNENQ